MRLRDRALLIVGLTMLCQFAVLGAAAFVAWRAGLPADRALAVLAGAVVATSLGALIGIVHRLDAKVLRPIARLGDEITAIGESRDTSLRVTPMEGKDEVAELAARFNRTLEVLEDSEQELRNSEALSELAVRVKTQDLERSERWLRDLVEYMADAVFLIDNDGRFTLVNRRAELLTGRSRREILTMACDDLLDPSSVLVPEQEQEDAGPFAHWTWEVEMVRADNRRVPVELHAALVYDTDQTMNGTIWIAHDITRRKRAEAQLIHMAGHDDLTNLFNRRRLEEEIDLRLEHATQGVRGAVLWLDIDNFKDVNDSLGHRAGDEVLRALADHLRMHIRGYAAIARIGGDEFAIVLEGVSEHEAAAAANRVLTEVNRLSIPIDGHLVHVGVSMGVVLFPRDGTSAKELLAKADAAMYYAKSTGRGRLHLHVPDDAWHAEISSRLTWRERLERALRGDEFLIYAQPILRLSPEAVERHELLIRLPDGEGGVIPPVHFLPAAESLGLIQRIDRWMSRQAVGLLEASAGTGLCLDVNLSGRAFEDVELLNELEEQLRRTGVDPSRLGFEITETEAIADITRAREFIDRVKAIGCRISLDDFGSGFSSFYYLKHLPIDYLKIDGNFIRDLPYNKQDQHLVRALVELCRSLGIQAVAEYVENGETLQILRDLEMDFGQGYHIGRPVPVTDLLEDEGVQVGLA